MTDKNKNRNSTEKDSAHKINDSNNENDGKRKFAEKARVRMAKWWDDNVMWIFGAFIVIIFAVDMWIVVSLGEKTFGLITIGLLAITAFSYFMLSKTNKHFWEIILGFFGLLYFVAMAVLILASRNFDLEEEEEFEPLRYKP